MKKKKISGLVGVMAIAMFFISMVVVGGWQPEGGEIHVAAADKDLGTLPIYPAARRELVSAREGSLADINSEVIFTAPFDYFDNGTTFDVHPEEQDRWSARSQADDSGRCLLNVSAMNVSEFGLAGAYAVIGGTTTATHTYESPRAEFYFSAHFKIFDDIFLASKSQIQALYFYFEDDELLTTGKLNEWVEYTEGKEYNIDYTDYPLSLDLAGYGFEAGRTYTLLLFFEAYIEATGGSGTCYIDAANGSLDRYIQVEKIRLYDECAWGSDLEVADYALEWGAVTPGNARQGYIRLRNAGTPCSSLDWEIVSWPEWGTWTFDPPQGDDLTGRNGTVVINITVQAPNQEDATFTGDIIIINANDDTDMETLPVRLSTPISYSAREQLSFARIIDKNHGQGKWTHSLSTLFLQHGRRLLPLGKVLVSAEFETIRSPSL